MTGTWTQRAGFYVEHLSELGYRPQIDDDGDIYFRHEGGHYYILGTDDEQYVQVAYLNFWPIEDDDELRRALGMKPLPGSLAEAISVMETSELVAETLGEHVFDFFLRNKRAEWQAYRSEVTPFELSRYLPVL